MNPHQDWCQLPFGGKSYQLKSYEVLVHDEAPTAHPLQSDNLTDALPSKKPSKFRQNSDSGSSSDSDNDDTVGVPLNEAFLHSKIVILD